MGMAPAVVLCEKRGFLGKLRGWLLSVVANSPAGLICDCAHAKIFFSRRSDLQELECSFAIGLRRISTRIGSPRTTFSWLPTGSKQARKFPHLAIMQMEMMEGGKKMMERDEMREISTSARLAARPNPVWSRICFCSGLQFQENENKLLLSFEQRASKVMSHAYDGSCILPESRESAEVGGKL